MSEIRERLEQAGVVVLGCIAVYFCLILGPSGTFIWAYRHIGSAIVAEFASGIVDGTMLLPSLVYNPDSRSDADFIKCLRDDNVNPADAISDPDKYSGLVQSCSRHYDDSYDSVGLISGLIRTHKDDIKVRVSKPEDAAHQIAQLSVENRSDKKLVLGGDFFFKINGHSEYQHVTVLAFPGQTRTVEIKLEHPIDDYAWREFEFVGIANIARIEDGSVYSKPPA